MIRHKILQINVTLNTGSTGRITEQIGQEIIDAGWESYVAFGRKCNISCSIPIRIGKLHDVYMHGCNSLLFDNHGFSSMNATKKLIKKIENIKPDIIHLHNLHGYYINVAILFNYLKTASIPVVWTMHDCWSYTGHCAFYSDIKCSKWKTGCFNCPKRGDYPKSLFLDNSKKNYIRKLKLFTSVENLTIVPVSEWLGHEVKQSFFKGKRILPIINGLDTQTFSPKKTPINLIQKYKLEGKNILLGVASAWSPRKGINDYAELAKILPDNYQIVMIGLTKKQSKYLPNNILKLQRTENVNELAEWYSLATLVLNLSSSESFGLTTAEGFACGTPSIVYNCTASPELISPGTGIIVEKGNIKSLFEAVQTITEKGKSFFLDNCRKRAITHFNKNIQYKKYLLLYNEPVGGIN